MKNPTPQSLLVDDLREILIGSSDPAACAALRRVNLFSFVYLEGNEMGSKLVLEAVGGYLIVADELDDKGRCHVLDEPPFYAVFDRENMVLEYRKASVDISSIVFEAEKWPEDLTDKTPNGVRQYFGE